MVENLTRVRDDKFVDLFATTVASTELTRNHMQKMSDKITILTRVVAGGSSSGTNNSRSNFKVPKPKTFGGSQNDNDLEKFFWDMKQYFKTDHIVENENVMITNMYLIVGCEIIMTYTDR